MRMRMSTWVLALALSVGAVAPAPLVGRGLAAQGGGLDEVESLVARGRIEEARSELLRWWEAGEKRSRLELQRGIWLRARLTVDPAVAATDYRRLVVEFPGGAFTDDALLRLGRMAEVEGRLAEAAEHFRVLVRDYPGSPLGAEARAWLDAHREALAALPQEVLPAPDTARPGTPARTESGRQGAGEARLKEGRDTLPPPEAEGERRPPATEPGAVAAPASVQAGAFRSLERARRLERRLRAAGFEPRLVRVPGSPLVRVRVGRFPTRAAATEVLAALRAAGFEATVVMDAAKEEIVR